jgi:hypothetical protein
MPYAGASDALARFVATPQSGAQYEAALGAARVSCAAALTALDQRGATLERAARALVSYGVRLRRAFLGATAFAGAETGAGARGDAAIVAAAMVSSELAGHDEDGENTAEAIAIGREVAARLTRALTLDAPWDAVTVFAGVAAAAAAARALGLDADAARNAIGLAATQAAGLGAVEGTPIAAIACGKAAADAVEAALLARHGFTAAPASIEGRRGLAALMGSTLDEAALLDGLGQRWFSAER